MSLERFPSGNLGDIILSSAPHHASYLDLRGRPRRYAFSEMDDLASRLAGGLAKQFKPGDRVAIIAENGSQFIISYLGLMRAGLVAVPVNYRLPQETIDYVLADCEAQAVIADGSHVSLVPSGMLAINFDSDDNSALSFAGLCRSARLQSINPGPDDIAEILYTSGSTGRPKGVPLSHSGQLWALERFIEQSSKGEERTIVVAPTYHMNGLFFTTVALALGYFIISMPKFEARAYLKAVAEHQCTMVSGIPTMFALMARETELLGELDLSRVRQVMIGSAPLTKALLDRVKAIFPEASIRNGYGTTESGAAMFGPHPQGNPRPPLALGYPYPQVEWRLVGGTHSNEGMLETRTPAVLKEYLNLPGVSAEKISDGWYRTGDVMRRDEQGFFYFVGRADDMFVCGGENIYPGEVEKLIERHPGVLQAAVVAADDDVKGAIPIAFVVRTPGSTATESEIKAFTLTNGPAYAHPRAVVFLDFLPVGGTHKVDRSLLTKRAAEIARTLGR